jgi:hypothetical protein
MVKVETQVAIYEEDTMLSIVGQRKHMQVKSHWNNNRCAELVIDGKSIWVNIHELKTALDNASSRLNFKNQKR